MKYGTLRAVYLHLLCWCIFILYEVCLLYYSVQKFTISSFVSLLLYYLVNIGIFYGALFILDRNFRDHVRYLNSILLFLGMFTFFLLVKSVLSIWFDPAPANTWKHMWQIAWNYIPFNAIRGIYFCLLAALYRVASSIAGFRKQAALAEKKQLIAQMDQADAERRLSETRNAYLQQQLNPHLLFNTLGFIHSAVYPHSADAANCVVLLSDILRFSLDNDSVEGKTPVTAELEQVKNLIELNRYRFDHLFLQTDIETVPDKLRIIPLVLLTLTENIFKHGILNDPEHPARLEIGYIMGGQLTYHSHNRIKHSSKPGRAGLGLQNTRLRLEHSYPGMYRLEIKEEGDFFHLSLSINL